MNTHKMIRQRNSDTKNRQQRTTTKIHLRTVSNELLGGGESSFTVPTSPVEQNTALVGCSVRMITL